MAMRLRGICVAFLLALTAGATYLMSATSALREEMLHNLLALTGHLLIQPRVNPVHRLESGCRQGAAGSRSPTRRAGRWGSGARVFAVQCF